MTELHIIHCFVISVSFSPSITMANDLTLFDCLQHESFQLVTHEFQNLKQNLDLKSKLNLNSCNGMVILPFLSQL
jgi:hypothetical protein